MAITLYTLAVPPLLTGLKNLSHCLRKAETHAKDTNTDASSLTTARLYPDMAPFYSQIFLVTQHAEGASKRIIGGDLPVWPGDKPESFSELLERLAKTITFLESVKAEDFEGKEETEIRFEVFMGKIEYRFSPPEEYLLYHAYPNFWFHVTTAYDILRSKGVPLGKQDFVNGTKNLKNWKE